MVVSVVFRDNPKKYDYLTDIDLRKGELVVVPVGSPDAWGVLGCQGCRG